MVAAVASLTVVLSCVPGHSPRVKGSPPQASRIERSGDGQITVITVFDDRGKALADLTLRPPVNHACNDLSFDVGHVSWTPYDNKQEFPSPQVWELVRYPTRDGFYLRTLLGGDDGRTTTSMTTDYQQLSSTEKKVFVDSLVDNFRDDVYDLCNGVTGPEHADSTRPASVADLIDEFRPRFASCEASCIADHVAPAVEDTFGALEFRCDRITQTPVSTVLHFKHHGFSNDDVLWFDTTAHPEKLNLSLVVVLFQDKLEGPVKLQTFEVDPFGVTTGSHISPVHGADLLSGEVGGLVGAFVRKNELFAALNRDRTVGDAPSHELELVRVTLKNGGEVIQRREKLDGPLTGPYPLDGAAFSIPRNHKTPLVGPLFRRRFYFDEDAELVIEHQWYQLVNQRVLLVGEVLNGPTEHRWSIAPLSSYSLRYFAHGEHLLVNYQNKDAASFLYFDITDTLVWQFSKVDRQAVAWKSAGGLVKGLFLDWSASKLKGATGDRWTYYVAGELKSPTPGSSPLSLMWTDGFDNRATRQMAIHNSFLFRLIDAAGPDPGVRLSVVNLCD